MVAASLLVGCGGETMLAPPLGLSHAVASFGCGPTDGTAVTITLSRVAASSTSYFAAPATPYLQFTIWQDVRELNGSYLLASERTRGVAALYTSTTQYELAIAGTAIVTSVSPDNRIRGSIDAEFPTIGRIRGGFDATWKPLPPGTFLCG
jgi:hypothetical protein